MLQCCLALFILLTIPTAWADPGSCNPSPPAVVTYNLGSSGSDALLAGGGSAAGCAQINNQFTNFAYTGTTPAGSAVSTQFSGTSEAVQDIDFTSNQFSSSSTFESVDFKFVVTLNPADIPPAPDSIWSITGLNLAIAGGMLGNASEQLNIDIAFCANATICTDSSSGVNDGRLAYFLRSPTPISEACFNSPDGSLSCSSPTLGSSSSFGTSLGAGVQSIAFDVVIEYLGDLGATESMSGLDITFDQTAETPEPSSGALLGSAIVILALAWHRRRKHPSIAVRADPDRRRLSSILHNRYATRS